MHPDWIPLSEVGKRPYGEAVALFRKHVNPGLVTLLEMGEYTAIDPQEGWTIKEQEHQSHMSGKDGIEVRTLGVTHFDSRTGTLVPD